MPEELALTSEIVARLAPLVSIGGKSGDTVVGLSAVRRVRQLAYIFVGANVAENTWTELVRRRSKATRVLRVPNAADLTAGLGRHDASIIAIKTGPLAKGIAGRLTESTSSS